MLLRILTCVLIIKIVYPYAVLDFIPTVAKLQYNQVKFLITVQNRTNWIDLKHSYLPQFGKPTTVIFNLSTITTLPIRQVSNSTLKM